MGDWINYRLRPEDDSCCQRGASSRVFLYLSSEGPKVFLRAFLTPCAQSLLLSFSIQLTAIASFSSSCRLGQSVPLCALGIVLYSGPWLADLFDVFEPMEYFDFDEAANRPPSQDDYQAFLASEAQLDPCVISSDRCFDDLQDFDEDLDLCPQAEPATALDTADTEMAGFDDFPSWIPGWIIPSVPCDYCRSRQLECMVIYKGQDACTSCVTLFRCCSFNREKVPGPKNAQGEPPGLATLHGVSEDSVTTCGEKIGRRLLRSTDNLTDDMAFLEPKGRKTGTRFSRESVRILKNWVSAHTEHPYPTDEEKDELKRQTGLKRSQISNWLANARRRGKTPSNPRCQSPSLGISATRAISIPTRVDSASLKNMNPLERWKISPPEHEPASVSAIANAVAISTPPLDKDASPYSGSWAEGPRDSSAGDSFSVIRAPSMTSVETGRSSGSDLSFSSVFSHHSRRSFGSTSKDRRRRRRQNVAQGSTAKVEPKTFQCTFCTDTFKTKHDWSRHEKSLHLSLERWTCAPSGGIVPTTDADGNEINMCVYCHCHNPGPDHLETHNFMQCHDKGVANRTFYRKDHLRQHLRLTHACTFLPSMELWKAAPTEIRSRCGICNAVFSTWQDRVDHIAKHFKAGQSMSDWRGDWGFDPVVIQMVENAVPPWLIPQERQSQLPFSAEAMQTDSESVTGVNCLNGDRIVNDARHCYLRLERELGAYVREQAALGITPSDEELMKIGRIISYGTDDPWNQGAADNPEWLSRFKRLHGLEGPPLDMVDSGLARQMMYYCSFDPGVGEQEQAQ